MNQNPNKALGLKSIRQMQKKQLGEKLREQANLQWIFEKWYEKLFLMILLLMGCWKVWGLIF